MRVWRLVLLVVALAPCLIAGLGAGSLPVPASGIVILISDDAEWRVVRSRYPRETGTSSPWGEFFQTEIGEGRQAASVIFFHGGWGKAAAAGSTQYCIDKWKPRVVINLGTCGGFRGDVARYEVILADRTVIYDIREAMSDPEQAIADYATSIDLTWLGTDFPVRVRKTLLVSADRDIVPSEIPELRQKYQAVAADWESGAIAYTCARNKQRILILRGVSDLVGTATGGEAYGKPQAYEDGAKVVMTRLLDELPLWLEKCR
jgi:adenosylhomocysteine nucleosidase